MLINADIVKVVPEVLYIAMIDSLRQQFYPRMRLRQAGRDRKISVIERDILVPCMRILDAYRHITIPT